MLFSGGQDSTVCLGWALDRFDRVETVGFDYGQRHRVELEVRGRASAPRVDGLKPAWSGRLGEDHVIDLAVLGQLSDTALTRDVEIAMADSGLPTTFVPGRNLIFLTFAAALAYRRGIRHIVAGMCETDYSGYPDCRDDTIKAMQVALIARPRPAGHRPHAADVDRQGRHLRAGGGHWRADASSIWWSRRPTPAISATARTATPGAMAAAPVRPAGCAPRAGRGSGRSDGCRYDTRRRAEGVAFLVAVRR